MTEVKLREIRSIETLSEIFRAGRSVFVICKTPEAQKSTESKPISSKPTTESKSKPKFKIPESVRWHEQNHGFSWDFVKNQDGTILEETRALVELLEKGGPLTEDGFRYSLSKDGRFLNRIKLEPNK